MLAAHPLWMIGTIPFVALLLLIALLPLTPRTAKWWHSNANKAIVALACAVATAVYLLATDTVAATTNALLHTLLEEYIPFITLLGSLFVIAGGISLRLGVRGTPAYNTAFLALGAIIASLLGTTGASVLLIRPLLEMNKHRRRVAHTVVFFIFAVSNIGGLLLPTGDPPLFLGYLRGIPFFWTLSLWAPWAFTLVLLLGAYFCIDQWMERGDTPVAQTLAPSPEPIPMRIEGCGNLLWLGGVLASVVLLVPGRPLVGTAWIVPAFAREGAMLALALVSLATTPSRVRISGGFSWAPIVEVAVLFVGIFVAMQVPLAVLAEGGASGRVTSPSAYFWATGILSSFLDNAPTYLVFLTSASVDVTAATASHIPLTDGRAIDAGILAAISLGAVFMGANTYIGNGPNFMVKAIAEESGVPMPSFFGYMGWAIAVLIPVFVLVSLVFCR
jgi:Na+/H+ antiporter NhaD/arsenite permease-like protein